jgi:hypothetical protein
MRKTANSFTVTYRVREVSAGFSQTLDDQARAILPDWE